MKTARHLAAFFLLLGGACIAGPGTIYPVGVPLVTSIPPSDRDWMLVLGILANGGERGMAMAADATVCVRGDARVVRAIRSLYHTPGLEQGRARLARPLSGLRDRGAVLEVSRMIMSPEYPPDHELVASGARSVLRLLGSEGVLSIVDKLSQWGELPDEEHLDQWAGMPLCELLASGINGSDGGGLVERIRNIDGSTPSGGRLGAACALLGGGGGVSASAIGDLAENEQNTVVRDCLRAAAAGRAGKGALE